jgi:2Fe-2S ferredoxin
MAKVHVNVTDFEGKQQTIAVESGTSVMVALRDRYLVEGACGGNCACATCHVYVDPEWYEKLPQADSFEIELVSDSSSYIAGASRLSCQIAADDALDGIKVTLAKID